MANKPSRILLIEDNGTVRAILAAALVDAGYEVIEAPDGMSGLMLAESAAPDLAVLDLHLPDLSGLEIASLFHQRLPFLVLTTDADSAPVKRCTDFGALGYLVKPPDLDNFLRQVQIALRRGWENLNLKRAVQETQVIAKALGILIGYHDLSNEAAYQQLLSFSTTHHQRIADVANEIIRAFHQRQTMVDGSSTAKNPPPKVSANILKLLEKPHAPDR